MKKSEMLEISQNRQNLTAFLHITEIKIINLLLADGVDVNHMNFEQICNTTLEQYQAKKISNRKAARIFEILAFSNRDFKIEKFRCSHGYNEIYKYSPDHGAYLFYCKGGQYKLNELVRENGRFA
ncbi:hypothetical protein [Moraxella catarrhalis]|uniref:Uncharacterized protein n=1 Tax=Moraxella catarrhalis TaxID=480 RepID=A0A198UQQ9_MORCA|nr:hypothetical protein [Moraxella catarrhalis]OAU97592.1 hypothetical protein AO384_0628 [Moraxella catarrhalis]OAU97658.1 hypothetical protein AO383_0869 [Moraxella catarrhalis]OAV02453.1 hypothetical protein AO385_0973 [Moraxella catarrhalis]